MMRNVRLLSCGVVACLAVTAATAGEASAGSDRHRAPAVTADVETPPLLEQEASGNANADDPAIWVNAEDPDESLVIATAKEGGLRVYDLAGHQVQAIAAPAPPRPGDSPGRFNNVDLVAGLRFPDGRADVAVVSDRGRDQLRTYRIDPDAATPLTDVTDPAAPLVFSASQDEVNEQATAYGLATYRDRRTGVPYALASQRHTTAIARAKLTVTAAGGVTYQVTGTVSLPHEFQLPDGTSWSPCGDPGELPQVEGMAVDTDTGRLFAGQEDVGIWQLPASLGGTPELVDKVREYGVDATYDPETDECVAGQDPGYGGEHIAADVEGLTIAYDEGGDGYLLASSQGDNRFVAYDRDGSHEYEGDFTVSAGDLDGSEECDGAAVVAAPVGSQFPDGLLVVQDGSNTPDITDPAGEPIENTNFKFVDWSDVVDAAGL